MVARGRKRSVFLCGRTVEREVAQATEEFSASRCYEEIMAFFDAACIPLNVARLTLELVERELDDREL